MGNKLSSYKKLKTRFKHREQDLISDIVQLVEHSEEYSGKEVREKWQMLLDQERVLIFGERTN